MSGKQRGRQTRNTPQASQGHASRQRPPAAKPAIWNQLLVGWIGLTCFAAFGLLLEFLHGFKMDFYLDLRHETRRLMWTLTHTHGTLFSLVTIVSAATAKLFALDDSAWLRFSFRCLKIALFLMPLGFFLGGLWHYDGDPGLGILLAPVGAACFLLSSWGMAQAIRTEHASD